MAGRKPPVFLKVAPDLAPADVDAVARVAEYVRAQKLVADARLKDAAEVCRRIVSAYGDTPAGERAQKLLSLLEERSKP